MSHAAKTPFDGFNHRLGRDHWAVFEQFIGFHESQHNVNHFEEFKKVCVFTLSGYAQAWYNQIKTMFNSIQELKYTFSKSFNCLGKTTMEQMAFWNTMKFKYT